MWHGFLDLPWWGNVLALLGLTHITIVAVTVFLHRNQTHSAIHLAPFISHFFRLWLWLTTGMVTKEWVAIHRKHHAKCEGVEDPHSPVQYGLPRVLFGGVFLYVKESHNSQTITQYGQGTPNDWIEKNLYSRFPWLGVTIMAVVDLALFGLIAGPLMWGVQMIWIPFWAAGVINGVGHAVGYRNWDCPDASTNIVPWGIVIGGEELHNNHHTFPTSAKFSVKPWEFDLGWGYVRLLEIVGQAKVKFVAPQVKLLDQAKPRVDAHTLQAIVRNRYAVIRAFAGDMADTCRRELSEHGIQFSTDALSRLVHGKPLNATELQILALSPRLQRLHELRLSLAGLWERSSASTDELVERLSQWCAEAEASGISALEHFSQKLRRFA